jgi:integrase
VEAEEVRVLSSEQLAVFLAIVHPRHRLFFELLASTGLRVSEAIALHGGTCTWTDRGRT